MKKGILLIVIAALIAFLFYQFVFKQDDPKPPKPAAMVVTGSDTLTVSLAAALQHYYDVKDAFVKSDTGLVNKSANAFLAKLNAVDMNNVKADTSLVQLAVQLQQNVGNETKNIIAASGIEQKRRSFQIMSDAYYDLLRTVRYSGSKVYQQFCPMAFDNTGAAWLSNSTEVINPYFGDKMLHCGDVRDSISLGK